VQCPAREGALVRDYLAALDEAQQARILALVAEAMGLAVVGIR
jgi:hypothetical protein